MKSLTLRFSPEFVVRVSELLQRLAPSEIEAGTEVLGPLFGFRTDEFITAKTFRAVPIHNLRLNRQEYFHRAFDRLLTLSKTDAELTSLELIGWFCIRSADGNGLLDSDIAFQNLRFAAPSDLMAILRPRQAHVSIELYATTPKGFFSSDDCWSGAGTFDLQTSTADSIEFSIAPKANFEDERALVAGPPQPADWGLKTPHPTLGFQLAQVYEAASYEEPRVSGSQQWAESALGRISSLRWKAPSWAAAALVITMAVSAVLLGVLGAKSPLAKVDTPRAVATPVSKSELHLPLPALEVTPVPVYKRPVPLKRALPDPTLLPPSGVREVKRVSVHVDIDETGRVTDARLAKGDSNLPEPLAASVLKAAKHWTFKPAMRGEQPVASDHTIIFEFQPPDQ